MSCPKSSPLRFYFQLYRLQSSDIKTLTKWCSFKYYSFCLTISALCLYCCCCCCCFFMFLLSRYALHVILCVSRLVHCCFSSTSPARACKPVGFFTSPFPDWFIAAHKLHLHMASSLWASSPAPAAHCFYGRHQVVRMGGMYVCEYGLWWSTRSMSCTIRIKPLAIEHVDKWLGKLIFDTWPRAASMQPHPGPKRRELQPG